MARKPRNIPPAFVLGLICFFVALLLAATNALTAPIIERAAAVQENENLQVVFPQADAFDTFEWPDALTDHLSDEGCLPDRVYVATSNAGDPIGYAFVTRATGYGGCIEAMTAIQPDGSILLVIIDAPEETPRLGTLIEEDAFTASFAGLPTDKALTSSDIDMVSGATVSSSGALRAVNQAVTAFQHMQQEGVIE